MKERRKKEKIIGWTALSISIAIFSSFLGVYVSKQRLQQQINEAQKALDEAFDLSQKLEDDEYYQIYTPNGNYLITKDGKILIDFGK